MLCKITVETKQIQAQNKISEIRKNRNTQAYILCFILLLTVKVRCIRIISINKMCVFGSCTGLV